MLDVCLLISSIFKKFSNFFLKQWITKVFEVHVISSENEKKILYEIVANLNWYEYVCA